MPSIMIRRDGKPSKEVALDKELTLIGQKADADIQIEDPAAVAERASILQIGEDFILNDLGPANDTLVNGQPVKKCILKDRDLITIGEYRMTFQDKRSIERPLGIEAEAAEIESQEALPRPAGKPGDPLLADPNKKTELVTYAVIAAAVLGMSYWGYQSYVAREAREAQAAEAQAALAKAEAKRKEAEKSRDITREVTAPLNQTEPVTPAPAGGQNSQSAK